VTISYKKKFLRNQKIKYITDWFVILSVFQTPQIEWSFLKLLMGFP
jgi:hypothetical protein